MSESSLCISLYFVVSNSEEEDICDYRKRDKRFPTYKITSSKSDKKRKEKGGGG